MATLIFSTAPNGRSSSPCLNSDHSVAGDLLPSPWVRLIWKEFFQLPVRFGEMSMTTAVEAVRAPAPELGRVEDLVDVLFANSKELRHQAEQILGRLFVPTEVVHEDELSAQMILRPDGMPEVHVHAARERHWYPYRITRVDSVAR